MGKVVPLKSPDITAHAVRDANVLIVRSETRVNGTLLDGSKVAFVGTVTVGIDHLDTEYLLSRGIPFASAPGSNANAVKEYVIAALLSLAATRDVRLQGKTLGIVGSGNIGSRLATAARGLGMETVECDPPLGRRTQDQRYVPLDRVLDCDVISVHVPLTQSGPDATYHLFDEARFRRIRPGSVFVNTSRGAVAETRALFQAIRTGRIADSVIDVWEHEPAIDADLLAAVTTGTAHIAGYSLEGRVNAVRMVRDAVRAYLGINVPRWEPSTSVQAQQAGPLIIPARCSSPEAALSHAVGEWYDITLDDRLLRRLLQCSPDERASGFRRLRSGYHFRREFSRATVQLPPGLETFRQRFLEIGFGRVVTAAGGEDGGTHRGEASAPRDDGVPSRGEP